MRAKWLLSKEEIDAHFIVDPDAGIVMRKTGPKKGLHAGFSAHNGYTIISLNKKRYRLHHIVWTSKTGKIPAHEIDHINGVRGDNRFCNLRAATVSQNRTNKKRSSNNTSGFKWVHWDKQAGRWSAQVHYRDENGFPRRYDSKHPTPEQAYEAAKLFAKEKHGQWFNAG